MRDLHLPGRSPARAMNAMAATSHPLATATALAILRDGGNAVDAAIAACAVQCVVEPQSTGIGGDCFAILCPGGDAARAVAYNGSGRAPMAATPDWYRAQGIDAIQRATPHAVTVPGAVEAWARLHTDHGRLDLARVLAAAVGYAEGVYRADGAAPVHEALAPEAQSLTGPQRAHLEAFVRLERIVHATGLLFLPHAWIRRAARESGRW